MKKLLAILLSAILLLGAVSSAFAVGGDGETGIDDVEITVYMPLCGAVVTEDNPADAAEVYVDPEGVRITGLELVREFDPDTLTGEPFTGVIEGGEVYALLMTLETEEGFRFAEQIGWGLPADGDDIFISVQSETMIRVAVVCMAEHDWGEWTLTEEPTEDEDGLWERVCQGDPDHVETAVAPAGEDPVEPGAVGPVLHEIEIEIYAPVCGNEITDENRQDAVWVYYYPECVMTTEHCELVTDYDPEDPAVFTPFLGTVIGGERYTALLTFYPDEEHRFAEEAELCVTCLDDAYFRVLERSEDRITLAVDFTAEHDWGDWEVVKEPTEDEDGLWERVCQYDPSHVETEEIPALTEGQIPEFCLDLTFPCCGEEVDEAYSEQDETVYLYGDGVFLENSMLVSGYDPASPEEAAPFTGTAVGGEEYTFLIWLKCGDGRWFDEDTGIYVDYPEDADTQVLEMTEHTMTLAVTAAAEHIWGDWYIEKEPTENEDGLWMRVCEVDPGHVETEIIPAGTEPVPPDDPDDPWDPGHPDLFAAEIEVMTPVCGDEVTEDNSLGAVWVYPWPEDTMEVERCVLVTDYDSENPAVFTPFLGTIIGGEEYTFLLTITPDEDHWFEEDMEIGFYEEYLYSWEILEQTDQRITLAVTFTADHDWDEWVVIQEPTDDEDGLMQRVCLYDPDHVETEIIPAGTDPYAPEPEIDPVAPADEPTEPTDGELITGGMEMSRDVPDTGDGSHPAIWCVAAVMSLAALAALAIVRKRREV